MCPLSSDFFLMVLISLPFLECPYRLYQQKYNTQLMQQITADHKTSVAIIFQLFTQFPCPLLSNQIALQTSYALFRISLLPAPLPALAPWRAEWDAALTDGWGCTYMTGQTQYTQLMCLNTRNCIHIASCFPPAPSVSRSPVSVCCFHQSRKIRFKTLLWGY